MLGAYIRGIYLFRVCTSGTPQSYEILAPILSIFYPILQPTIPNLLSECQSPPSPPSSPPPQSPPQSQPPPPLPTLQELPPPPPLRLPFPGQQQAQSAATATMRMRIPTHKMLSPILQKYWKWNMSFNAKIYVTYWGSHLSRRTHMHKKYVHTHTHALTQETKCAFHLMRETLPHQLRLGWKPVPKFAKLDFYICKWPLCTLSSLRHHRHHNHHLCVIQRIPTDRIPICIFYKPPSLSWAPSCLSVKT